MQTSPTFLIDVPPSSSRASQVTHSRSRLGVCSESSSVGLRNPALAARACERRPATGGSKQRVARARCGRFLSQSHATSPQAADIQYSMWLKDNIIMMYQVEIYFYPVLS